MIKHILFFLIISISALAHSYGQNTPVDTAIVLDSLVIVVKEKKTVDYPNPNKALVYSVVLPGAGQIYNKDYWKLPFVYGALGGIIYLADFNNQTYQRLDDALRAELRGDEHEFSGIYNSNALVSLRNRYDRWRQQSYVGIFLVYAIIGVEAYIDAHLANFDVSDDLSLQLGPKLEPYPGSPLPAPGLGLTVRFSSSR